VIRVMHRQRKRAAARGPPHALNRECDAAQSCMAQSCMGTQSWIFRVRRSSEDSFSAVSAKKVRVL
jgi:hypothetical protein